MMKERQLSLFTIEKASASNKNRYKLILPLDALFLGTAVAILLLILSFSLGVEKGKKIASLDTRNNKILEEKTELLNDDYTEKAKAKEDIPSQEPITQAQTIEETTKTEETEKEAEKKKEKYRIQVASFHKENSANIEAQRLKKKGYPVLVMKKGDYVVVYVGSFQNEKEAKNNFKTLKEKYTDCILRRL